MSAVELDRRGFLRLLGVAASAGVLPLGCLSAPRRRAVLEAALRRAVGPRGSALDASGALDLAAAAEAWLGRLGPVADALDGALLALEYGVWPLVPKLRPFSALDEADQDAVLADLRDSRWRVKRQLFAGVKSLAMLAYYSDPASHEAIGYPGPFGDVSRGMVGDPEA